MADIKLSVKDISKSFINQGTRDLVLDQVSFDVYENELLVILGPGQCGKTVLLNTIAGMEMPDSGEILTEKKDDISFVFQRYALFGWKTVLNNVAAPLEFTGVDKKTRHEIAGKYIRLVGLEGFEQAYPAQLSGGMKQRVGIARAYASGKKIILMDEPFGALDAQTRYQMQDKILEIREKENATIVFVTNNIEEAVYLGDRILLFSEKPTRVVQEYIPDLPRPRHHTAKAFMDLRNEITANMSLVL